MGSKSLELGSIFVLQKLGHFLWTRFLPIGTGVLHGVVESFTSTVFDAKSVSSEDSILWHWT